jgi:hypothetical protein
MKMGRRLRCFSVTYDLQIGSFVGPAAAGPAAHFDSNATTPVADLVH